MAVVYILYHIRVYAYGIHIRIWYGLLYHTCIYDAEYDAYETPLVYIVSRFIKAIAI